MYDKHTYTFKHTSLVLFYIVTYSQHFKHNLFVTIGTSVDLVSNRATFT